VIFATGQSSFGTDTYESLLHHKQPSAERGLAVQARRAARGPSAEWKGTGGNLFAGMNPCCTQKSLISKSNVLAAIRGVHYLSLGLSRLALASWMPYKILPH
jgi:hypothetical protein